MVLPNPFLIDVCLPTPRDLLRRGVHPLAGQHPNFLIFLMVTRCFSLYLICLMWFSLVSSPSALSECGKQSDFSLLCTQLLCTGTCIYTIDLASNTSIINPQYSNLCTILYPEINIIFIFTPVYTSLCSLAFSVILSFFIFFFFTVHSGHIFKPF